MIQYALKCDAGHVFDSWFRSATAFDALLRDGHLSCAVCGTTAVQKAVMAPRVAIGDGPPDLAAPRSAAEAAMTRVRAHIEKTADYVGPKFAQEARAMFSGDVPERAIYGEANGAEAKALIDEGVPVAPLPFVPKQRTS